LNRGELMDQVLASLGEEGRFRILLDAITDYAIYMISPEGIVSSWNAGAARLKGYTEAEILGQNFANFYTPEDRERGLPQRALRIASTEGRFESEGWRVRKDGNRFWAHVVVDAIRDPTGRLIGFAKVTRDLTERRTAQMALQASEEQFRRLVEGVTDYAIYMISPEGIVTNWNAGAQRIKGYTRDEIVGHHFRSFYVPEDREAGEPERALTIARAEGRYEREGWRVRKDGTRFRAHVVIDAIYNDDGTLLGFAKITRDITERQQAQDALEQTREQLFQAQKLEAVGQLTGGIAHDFNNLLMAVLSSLDLATKRLPPGTEVSRWLANATEGARRGVTLTQRLLAFARRQTLEFRPVDLTRLVGDMTELLQRSLGTTIHIETRFEDNLPLVRTDAVQLETAILNLAVNARDAMPAGGRLTIAAELATPTADELPPGRYVRLSVSDEGEGMSPETLQRATEPFFTTKGVGKGTGLGLSMVHGLAQQSGGRLSITSVEGRGTTASIWLPVIEDDEMLADEEPELPLEVSPEADPARRHLNVLAVDDDALVLMNTAAMLEDLGHTVVEAYSAEEALGHLDAQPFDLVVTDHAMPRMTGAQLAVEIMRRWPSTGIILATGYAELPEGEELRLPRLNKPFSEADLSAAISAMGRRQGAA